MTETIENKNSQHLLIFWGLIGLTVIIGAVFVFFRIVDGDEGFYLSAAAMVKSGFRPYLDFFFPQMPGLPLIQAPFADHGWTTLYITRFIGLFCHLLLALLVYQFSRDLSGDKNIGLAALFLTLLSGPLLNWNSLAKPFPFTNLFLLASFIVMVSALRREKISYPQIGLAFLFLSMAVNIRSMFVILVPLYFFLCLFYLMNTRQLRKLHFALAVLLGLLIPSLYSLRLFVQAPGSFFFNNLGFHFLRADQNGFIYVIKLKRYVLLKVLIQPHFFIPIGLALWSLVIINSKKYRHDYSSWHKMVFQFALVIAAFIFIVYMIPHPVHVQYFNQILPFMIICGIPAIRLILEKTPAFKMSLVVIYLLALLLYPALYIIDVRGMHEIYSMENVKKVTQAIRASSADDDIILSEWVGYNVLSERSQVSGGEFVGYQYVFATPYVPYNRYQLLSNEKINELLKRQIPKLIVIKNSPIPEWEKDLDNNYRMLVQINKVLIYERKADMLLE
jgi:4-amino-4-deoxy-L-arabinose transferase-like glycosyltransferase